MPEIVRPMIAFKIAWLIIVEYYKVANAILLCLTFIL